MGVIILIIGIIWNSTVSKNLKIFVFSTLKSKGFWGWFHEVKCKRHQRYFFIILLFVLKKTFVLHALILRLRSNCSHYDILTKAKHSWITEHKKHRSSEKKNQPVDFKDLKLWNIWSGPTVRSMPFMRQILWLKWVINLGIFFSSHRP